MFVPQQFRGDRVVRWEPQTSVVFLRPFAAGSAVAGLGLIIIGTALLALLPTVLKEGLKPTADTPHPIGALLTISAFVLAFVGIGLLVLVPAFPRRVSIDWSRQTVTTGGWFGRTRYPFSEVEGLEMSCDLQRASSSRSSITYENYSCTAYARLLDGRLVKLVSSASFPGDKDTPYQVTLPLASELAQAIGVPGRIQGTGIPSLAAHPDWASGRIEYSPWGPWRAACGWALVGNLVTVPTTWLAVKNIVERPGVLFDSPISVVGILTLGGLYLFVVALRATGRLRLGPAVFEMPPPPPRLGDRFRGMVKTGITLREGETVRVVLRCRTSINAGTTYVRHDPTRVAEQRLRFEDVPAGAGGLEIPIDLPLPERGRPPTGPVPFGGQSMWTLEIATEPGSRFAATFKVPVFGQLAEPQALEAASAAPA